MTTEPNTPAERDYPELPEPTVSFCAVGHSAEYVAHKPITCAAGAPKHFYTADQMRAYVDADRASRARAAQAVPDEPTDEMALAGRDAIAEVHSENVGTFGECGGIYLNEAKAAWKAMLAAAPSAPAAPEAPAVAWEIRTGSTPASVELTPFPGRAEEARALGFEVHELVRRDAAPTTQAAPQPAAPQDEFLPLLARDIANELGTTSINVCNALRTLGFGCFSLNMAITKTMAAKLREHFADQPQEAAPAAVPDHVATVNSWTNGSYHRNYKLTWHKNVAEGTKLYAQPTEVPAQGDAEITSYAVGEARVERVLLRTGSYKWAVRMLGTVLNKQGVWEHEPQPSNRDDKFFERCRFDTAQDAIRAAIAQTKESGS